MPNFAILRFAKLKTIGAISGSAGHMMRTRPTANADPSRKNITLIGGDNPLDDVKERLADSTQKRRNSVLAIEVLLTTSHDWFATATKEQKNAWVKSSKAWLEKEFGKENVVSLHLHLDETTPHLTGFIVPIDPESSHLNASRWMDGKARLAKMQDDYAGSVASLGLERGIQGSDATHITMRQMHGASSKEVDKVPPVEIDVPPIMVRQDSRIDWADAESKKANKKIKPKVESVSAQAKKAIILEKRLDMAQATNVKLRDEASLARDIPLLEVAEKLGLSQDKRDKAKWRDDAGEFAISINGKKWFDHIADKGKVGSIDLVMHVTGWDFKQSVAWLGHGFDQTKTAAAVSARAVERSAELVTSAMELAPFAPPLPSPDHLDRVRSYLVDTRGLEAPMVEHLVKHQVLYADDRANAVFLTTHASGEVSGAERRGTGLTPFHGSATGSDREATFKIARGKPELLVLTESAIDACSWMQLHPRAENVVVASTSGARPVLPKSLESVADTAKLIIVAFDNDKAGRQASAKLVESLSELGKKVSAQFPSEGKDWNAQLLAIAKKALDAVKRVVPSFSTKPRPDISFPSSSTPFKM